MIKATLYFIHGEVGWSESHYLVGGSTVADGIVAVNDIAQPRAGILGTGWVDPNNQVPLPQPYIGYIRVSDTKNKRRFKYFTGPGNFPGRCYFASQLSPSSYTVAGFANDALRVNALGKNGATAICYLAGCPDGLFPGARAVDFANPPGFNSAWNVWSTAICAGKWGFLSRKLDAPMSPILGVASDAPAPGRLIIALSNPLNVTSANKVVISEATMANRAFRPLNGTYRIARVDNDKPNVGQQSIVLSGTEGRDPSNIEHPGMCQLYDTEITAYDPGGYSPAGVSTRKRGLPFKSPVGRRPSAPEYAD